MLQEKLEQQAPFYLSRHHPVVARKTDENNYQSALEAARARFEDRLEAEKSKNKKSLEEYHQFLDEANKFCELKALKDS